MIFVVSVKQGPQGNILVVTDEDIVGQIFEEGKLQLDLSKKFYVGEPMSKEAVKEKCLAVQHLHLTGKHAVGLGVEMDLVNGSRILLVNNVPHAQVVVVEKEE